MTVQRAFWIARAGLLRFTAAIAPCVVAFAIAMGSAPAAAQQPDLGAIHKRFVEFYQAGNFAAALDEAQKLEAAVKTRFGTNHANYALALNNLAIVYLAQGKYADAEGLHKRVLAIREKTLGASHPDVAATLNNLANVYQLQGKYADAPQPPLRHL